MWFVSLVNRERFDYTKWHNTLFEGMSVREISALAMKLRNQEKNINTEPEA